MTAQATHAPIDAAGCELRFPSLVIQGRGLAFACDAQGRVDLDTLSQRARDNHLGAYALVGREYAMPGISPRLH